jgi:hypothetical protein
MLRFALAAAISLLAANLLTTGASQAAQPLLTPSAPPRVIDRWDTAKVSRLLGELGVRDIHDATMDGAPGLLAQTPGGLNFGLYAKVCAPGAATSAESEVTPVCRGLEGWVSFAPDASVDRGLLADKLNHDYAAGKFTVERDGTLKQTRYLELAGGVTEANLKLELADFLTVTAAAEKTVWGDAATPAP